MYKLRMFREIFALLSRGAAIRFLIRSKTRIRGKRLVTGIRNSVQALLYKRHATLGCLRHVDKVTACARSITRLLGKAKVGLLSAEGAAPGGHVFRGCTMEVNNKGGRECGLSSKMLLGSGRVKTTNKMGRTVTTTGRCTPFIHGVRMRMRDLSVMGRTIRTNTSVVVLSGVSASTLGRTVTCVSKQTRVRISKGIAGRGVTELAKLNMSCISDKTLARSTPVLSVSLGGLRPMRGWEE